MANQETNRELDTLLDGLLAEYSSAEPRPGLEPRIQAALRTAAARRQRIWLLTFASSAAMAASLVLVVFWGTRTAKHTAPVYAIRREPSPRLPIHAPANIPRSAAPKRNGGPKGLSLTRLPDANQIALQIANTRPVFEHEESYLRPETQPMPETAPASEHEQSSVPSISIQDLGMRSIEIKELTTEKDRN